MGDQPRADAEAAGKEWFRRWFGPEYLALYPHRDREEAERAVDLFLGETEVERGASVLDVGCGAGRHLAAFRRQGVEPVGLDLSRPLLARAREALGDEVPLARGDMRRMPFRRAAFDALASFFTSFGYFRTPEEDRRALHEMRRVLRTGGRYLIDFLNAEEVRRSLVPEEVETIGGTTVRQTREVRDGRVVKRIEIEPEGTDGGTRVFHERVRLYEPEELTRLLRRADLPPEARYGDYGGAPHDAGSPRFIVAGRAE